MAFPLSYSWMICGFSLIACARGTGAQGVRSLPCRRAHAHRCAARLSSSAARCRLLRGPSSSGQVRAGAAALVTRLPPSPASRLAAASPTPLPAAAAAAEHAAAARAHLCELRLRHLLGRARLHDLLLERGRHALVCEESSSTQRARTRLGAARGALRTPPSSQAPLTLKVLRLRVELGRALARDRLLAWRLGVGARRDCSNARAATRNALHSAPLEQRTPTSTRAPQTRRPTHTSSPSRSPRPACAPAQGRSRLRAPSSTRHRSAAVRACGRCNCPSTACAPRSLPPRPWPPRPWASSSSAPPAPSPATKG